MSDYSKSPLDVLLANRAKGYVGLHLEQAVPLLDRDLNLLQDLIYATVRSVFTRYIGSGIPEGADGFAIQALAAPQDFVIAAGAAGPGTCLVGGIEVTIPASTTYKAQAGVPALTTPTAAQPDPRTDIVYLDVSFTEVDSTVDSDLNNSVDVGMETSVRLKSVWVVLVSEGIPVPAAPAGHVYYPLAQLQRPRGSDTITAAMITNLRQSRLTMSAIEQRLALAENVLLLPAFTGGEFSPKVGPPGTPVTLLGRNFNLTSLSVPTPIVQFGATPATIVAPPPTATVINVTAPVAPPGPCNISVTTAGGTAVTAGTFNLQPALPPPVFTGGQFSPKVGPIGTVVSLLGSNFLEANLKVAFGAVDATPGILTVSATLITVAVPVGAVTAAITIANAGGVATSATNFTVT